MPLGDPSIKKKLVKNLVAAVKDFSKTSEVLEEALAKREEICGDYLRAKQAFDTFVKKEIGEDIYQQLMQGRIQPTNEQRDLIVQALKLDDVGTNMVRDNADLSVMMDKVQRDANAARAANEKARKDALQCKDALDSYIDKKADMKNKGQKAEYAEWKKALRADLFG
jgi:hypothetical protein